ncbi:HIT family protein [Haloquadratum walsbyi]|uniref:Diadenosine tetraphosphate (Ap4A) hydrolase and other HIT family hydrolase n=1 Tax=Haloquadratum walsbyi J07HQW2 TaxID=1238425 RepID=U1PPL4_9EURY|nr:HIT family protein [Haloquadratum walsbyi]ERG94251.1 MAG: Diadenosine tetraphosphate (Ap4A) hydrolase and other HIT family hydrolase [Haloquadratum walsbyi J07HQW2]
MSDSNECVFCEIIDGIRDATVLVETNECICVLDKYPVNKEHALALPKAHVQHLNEFDTLSFYPFLERAITRVRQQYQPDGLNVGINDGSVAGQTIPHLHWHIIPRYNGDTKDPTGGVRGVIPSERTY